jgi:hypothetical protein
MLSCSNKFQELFYDPIIIIIMMIILKLKSYIINLWGNLDDNKSQELLGSACIDWYLFHKCGPELILR